MPHMKYFQAVADIRNSYDDLLSVLDEAELSAYGDVKNKYRAIVLEDRGVTVEDKPLILEEVNVLKYLIACQHGIAYSNNGENLHKPSKEAVERCFNRHIARLEDVFGIDDYNVNKHDNPVVKKQYKACRHYLFKFSLNGWVRSLPDVILSYENKYPKNK